MTRNRFVTTAVAAIGVAAALAAPPAEAGSRRLSTGAAAAIGAVGGFAAGAAIAGIARGPVYAAPGPYYLAGPAPVYLESQVYLPSRRLVVERACHVEHHDVWVPGLGWQPRRRTVCD